MIPITSLWLPIVASAVIVFLASFVLHMVLTYHRADLKKVPNEDEFLDTMRRLNIPPGDYGAPHAGSPAAMRDQRFIDHLRKGPLVFMTVAPGKPPGMSRELTQWFLFCAVVGLFAGYIAGSALPPGASYPEVFRFAGCTAFVGHALGQIPASIWYRKSWATTMRNVADGLIYGLVTGGTFGWLWPR